jgi:hypothetical protein
MMVRRLSAAFAAAALVSAVGGAAHAADRIKPYDFTVRSEPTAVAPLSGQTTRLDASKGRFGVTLSLQQPDARAQTLNDVAAGAYYRITPSLRVGGSVTLGDQQLQANRALPAQPADTPRVRLETKFKF